MNNQFKNNQNQDDEFARKLHEVAESTNANAHFMAELENKLKEVHQPKANWPMPAFKKITPALGWIALVIVFGFVLSWSIRNLIPTHQPGANTTPNQFVCPVTQPNESTPPGETVQDANYLGNGKLWTALWPNGKIYMLPENQEPDGSYSMKWGFWRGVNGTLTVEGHRLDAEAAPIRADIPDGYGDTGFQVLDLIFPTTGCWEVTGRVGKSSLTFVTEVVFGEIPPTPNFSINRNTATSETSTPTPDGGYAWRGTRVYLSHILPESPRNAKVYLLNPDQYITVVLNHQFGGDGIIMEGQPTEYETVGNYEIISAEEAFQKILLENRAVGLLEVFKGKRGGGGGGTGFYRLNLNENPIAFPTTIPTIQSFPTPQLNDLPTATIEVVVLNYYVRNPYSERWNPLYDIFIQPVWHFYGHYSTGDEFEILIQALKPEFLLPELAPYIPPG